MATVSLHDVKKRFGSTQVIHGVSAQIADGEFIVIVGPSGCGKSTLLRMVAGLETVSEGEIRIDDKRVNEMEPMDRDIAMVFQNYALYPHMSVKQNMAYSLKIAGVSKSQIDEKVAEAARLLQLSDYLERKPRQLSGGQRQRVAMGRAIVREPKVFLFDEPLSNLDAKLRVQMRLEIKQLQSRLGITALYVTHDQVEAMTMADRMIVMNSGIAEQVGTPLEVYEKPQTLFAAQFIGSPAMNIFSAKASQGKAVIGKDMKVAVPKHIKGDVMIGIRPEHLEILPRGPIAMTLQMAEPLGANTLLHGVLEGTGHAVTASVPGVHTVKSGEKPVKLGVASENIHIFDAQTGKRMD